MTKSSKFPEPYVLGGPSSKPEDVVKEYIPSQKMKQPQPLIDLQIYQDATKKPPPLADKQQAMMPLQPFALSSPFMPPQFQSYFNNFMKNFYTPFIYKDYHINLGGPSGDHVTASMVYEDVLPPVDVYSSYKTLKERNSLCEYVRGTFIKSDEGELVDFSGGPNSLNSRLKLIELNPFNTNIYSSNPYKGLPDDKSFLIYKSCYPIVYDKESSMVQCNKYSTGINVRAYKLNITEFIVKYFDSCSKMTDLKLNQNVKYVIDKLKNEYDEKNKDVIDNLNPIKYDVWREIIYYSWIRNKINYQNICPNFVSSYCYFINKNANISFEKNGLRIDLDKKPISELLSKEFTNCIMILLTESPNQNIYQWGSNTYIKERGILKMTHSGFKQESHWNSIIAQMLIIFYVMDKYCFTIRDMEINSNFYTKDLNVFGDNKQFWQYTIANIDYFIPNFGHLVMMDHNYKELKGTNIGKNRIMMKNEFEDNENEIKIEIIENAIKCFNPSNFGELFKGNGGVGLPNNIGNLFNNIYKDIDEYKKSIFDDKKDIDKKDVKDNFWIELIRKYLINYIHNRVGTQIRDTEVNYIRINDPRPRPYKAGELVVWEEKYESYKILLFIKNIQGSTTECECVSKNITTGDYEIINISRDLLYHYSEFETIKQDSKLGEPIIGYDYILERYIL